MGRKNSKSCCCMLKFLLLRLLPFLLVTREKATKDNLIDRSNPFNKMCFKANVSKHYLHIIKNQHPVIILVRSYVHFYKTCRLFINFFESLLIEPVIFLAKQK